MTALGLAALTAPTAHAQTILSGNYNGQPIQTSPGQSYVVTPSATFNGNIQDGLYVNDSDVTVNGGMFNNNGDYGLVTISGQTVTINGGTFDGNFHGLSVQTDSTLDIYGGAITNTLHNGLIAEGGNANIYGGTFSGNQLDLIAEGVPSLNTTITLYGDFSQYGPVTAPSGSITGTLADGGGLQTFTYQTSGGQIVLAPAPAVTPPAVPGPSSFALLGLALPALGLALPALGLVVRRRARKSCGPVREAAMP